jgi:uncharacterized protein (TIGR03435 family)
MALMRRAMLRLVWLLGAAVLFAVLGTVALRMNRQASAQWSEFSLGPPSGVSATINAGMVRSDGITLKALLALAYDIPAVRVIGPPWLAETRYSIDAVIRPEASESFRSLLQRELNERLRLQTHVEVRPFEVLVLTASEAPRLEPARGQNQSTWIQQLDAEFKAASMARLAAGLQNILNKSVVDESGIKGSYDLNFGWGESRDRLPSVTAVLRDRFGLRLSPGTRDMEALIVDGIRRDVSLVVLEQIGRISRAAPPRLRQRIAHVLRTH